MIDLKAEGSRNKKKIMPDKKQVDYFKITFL